MNEISNQHRGDGSLPLPEKTGIREAEAGVGGTGSGWEWRFLPFTLTEETEVTMTFYAEATTKYQWMSIGDGELLSANDIATTIAYDETTTNTIEAADVANVTITHNVKEGYNTYNKTRGLCRSFGTAPYSFS